VLDGAAAVQCDLERLGFVLVVVVLLVVLVGVVDLDFLDLAGRMLDHDVIESVGNFDHKLSSRESSHRLSSLSGFSLADLFGSA